ncbi:MAG: VTT domain-containing protein [Akkermansiaceae bacterium]
MTNFPIAANTQPLVEELLRYGEHPWLLGLMLALATFGSEDLACIAGGLIAAVGALPFPAACAACAIGIWSGDIGVYLLGKYGAKGAVKWQWLAKRMRPDRMARGARFFEKYGARWIFLTRFIPGSRVVSYLAAGATGWSLKKFALVLALAAIIWCPLLCGAAMLTGEIVLEWMSAYQRYALWILLGAGLAVWLLLKLILPIFNWRGRRLLYGKWLRLTRWEFWPSWVIYLPVGFYILLLAIRYRSLTLFTASSPAIPDSGFAMDSKGDILDLFPKSDMVPSYLHLPANREKTNRVESLHKFMLENQLDFPIVLKPDIGERGIGVAIIKSKEEATEYLQGCSDEVIAQEFCPGDEFGVYYVRMPDQDEGFIYSIAKKHPQSIIGNGEKNLEQLILEDPRAVAMARYYLRKFSTRLDEVPAKGEKVTLVEIGTHARGAVFTDERKLITPELTKVIDQLTQSAGAIHCGRYDLRVPHANDLKAGKNIRILEFNGVTGEPAHVYQPGYPLLHGIRDLCRQWKFAFVAGKQNRQNGHIPTSIGGLLSLIRRHRQKEWFDVDTQE